jgi:hypothetical protein
MGAADSQPVATPLPPAPSKLKVLFLKMYWRASWQADQSNHVCWSLLPAWSSWFIDFLSCSIRDHLTFSILIISLKLLYGFFLCFVLYKTTPFKSGIINFVSPWSLKYIYIYDLLFSFYRSAMERN